MIKFMYKAFIFVFFSVLIYVFLSNPYIIIDSVNYSVNVFAKNILPSLFPFFILADFLINYGYVNFLNKIFKFKYSSIIILSLISGLPSNAKYIKNALDKNLISLEDAAILLSTTFFPNPMFVIGSVGALMMGSVKIGVSLLLIVYLSNLIVYLFNYRKLSNLSFNLEQEKRSFPSLLKNSVINNIEALLVILGTIVIFTTLSNVIFAYIDLSPVISSVITSIFEMTSGIKKMSILNLSTHFRFVLICLALCFSGISVLCQAFSILSDYRLNIKRIIKFKLLTLLIAFIISYFYIILW